MERTRRFVFAFDPRFAPALSLAGVRPDTAYVKVGDRTVSIRFGPWRVRTPRHNVIDAQLDGPYRWWRAIGVRLSLADHGLTLGSNAQSGACLRLRTPVRGIEPLGLVRHPGITVTVADPSGLLRALEL